MAYLIFSWVKDVRTVVTVDVGKDLITLAGNAMPIGCAEELVTRSKRRHVVGVVGNISESVGHDDRGK